MSKLSTITLHGRSIRTFTGRYIDVFDPKPEMIDILDIAHALSNLCRFGGHVPKFYSVAEHAVLCSHLIEPDEAYDTLMHDATEAFLVDVPRPIKNHLANYKELEHGLMEVIASKYDVRYPFSERIHQVDNEALQMEWNTIMIGDKKDKRIKCLTPKKAELLFLERFYALKK